MASTIPASHIWFISCSFELHILFIMALTTSQCGPTLVLDLSLEEAFITAFLIKGCLSISTSFSSLGIVLRSYNVFVLINLEDRIVRTIIGGTRMFAFPDARLVDSGDAVKNALHGNLDGFWLQSILVSFCNRNKRILRFWTQLLAFPNICFGYKSNSNAFAIRIRHRPYQLTSEIGLSPLLAIAQFSLRGIPGRPSSKVIEA